MRERLMWWLYDLTNWCADRCNDHWPVRAFTRVGNAIYARNAQLMDAWLDEYNAQIDEETCSAHGVFCCDQCFDMSTAFVIELHP